MSSTNHNGEVVVPLITEAISNNPQALIDVKKRLRPYIYALMAFKKGRKFQVRPNLSALLPEEAPPPLTVRKIQS